MYRYFLSTVAAFGIVTAMLPHQDAQAQACKQWTLTGITRIMQDNGAVVKINTVQNGLALTGNATSSTGVKGVVRGTIDRTGFLYFKISWQGRILGSYTGDIRNGVIYRGLTSDSRTPFEKVSWRTSKSLGCAV